MAFPMDQHSVGMALCGVGLAPSCAYKVFGCVANYHDGIFC